MTPPADAALPARRSRVGALLAPAFFDRPTALVARDLLGATLEHRVGRRRLAGRIVETEAYLGPHDPACHASVGCTPRNRHLHGPAGSVYVYRIYGMHWCVNAVTRPAGHGSAVLLRAVVPTAGVDLMTRHRGAAPPRALADGPGKLCEAMGITGALDGSRLGEGPLAIRAGAPLADADVLVTPRIGITRAADWPLRFVWAGGPGPSRTPRTHARLGVAEARAWWTARAVW